MFVKKEEKAEQQFSVVKEHKCQLFQSFDQKRK
jgi:hypothetical protein